MNTVSHALYSSFTLCDVESREYHTSVKTLLQHPPSKIILNPLLNQSHRITDKMLVVRTVWNKHGLMSRHFVHVLHYHGGPVRVGIGFPMVRGEKDEVAEFAFGV